MWSRRAVVMAPLLWSAGCQAEQGAVVLQAYRVDPRRERVRFHWLRPDGTSYDSLRGLLDGIGARATVRMAMNGGIYGTDLRPLGLYIENGRRLAGLNLRDGAGNFYLKPNGVFYLRAGVARIVNAARFTDSSDVTDALQSGPLLIENGVIHPQFRPGSASRYVRNAVGITRDGGVVFLFAPAPVSLYDFSVAARDLHAVRDLLYLDGTISQMYVPPAAIPEPGRPFVTMITVELTAP